MGLSKLRMITVFLALIIAMPLSIAATFEYEIKPIDNSISLSDLASFNVSITNLGSLQDTFRIYSRSDPSWFISTKPLENPILLHLNASDKGSKIVYFQPSSISSAGNYAVDLNIESQLTDAREKEILMISVTSTEGFVGGYVPTVLGNINMPDTIDPRIPLSISITLSNQNQIDYEELTLRLRSRLINKELGISLGPNEEKQVQIQHEFDIYTPKATDTLTFEVIYDGNVITGPLVKRYAVSDYVDTDKETLYSGMLGTRQKVTITTNDPDYSEPYLIKINPWENLFTTTTPQATLIQRGGIEYLSIPVHPKDHTQEIIISKNYSALYLLVIAVLLGTLFYIFFRSPLTIAKTQAKTISEDGSVRDAKVILTVRNRSKKQARDIVVKDFVPNIMSIQTGHEIGSVAPTKTLRSGTRGWLIQWNIDSIEPSEEIVLSYNARSKLSVIGSICLDPSELSFKSGRRSFRTHSNRVEI